MTLVRATVGSESIRDYAVPLARACATLRDALAAGRTDGVLEAEERPIADLRAFASAVTTPNKLGAETHLAAAAEFLVAGDAGLEPASGGRAVRLSSRTARAACRSGPPAAALPGSAAPVAVRRPAPPSIVECAANS